MTSGARQYRVFFGTGTDELTGDEVEEWLMITESHALALTGKDYTVQTRICTEWEPLEGGVPLADTSARPK